LLLSNHSEFTTMEAKIYNPDGKEAGTIALPEKLFALPWNADLVQQVVVSMRSNERPVLAASRGRGEVRGGGKKPWKQKGTGRARHGSIRSPIWKGGGVSHGPKAERNYAKKINHAMKTKALFTLLSQKWRDNEIIFVNDLGLETGKTRAAAAAFGKLAKVKGLEKLAYKKGNRALVSLPSHNEVAVRSLRNLPTVSVEEARNLNPVDVLNYQYLVITEPAKSLEVLASRSAK
jgi:large subunit ribosomal protein L4